MNQESDYQPVGRGWDIFIGVIAAVFSIFLLTVFGFGVVDSVITENYGSTSDNVILGVCGFSGALLGAFAWRFITNKGVKGGGLLSPRSWRIFGIFWFSIGILLFIVAGIQVLSVVRSVFLFGLSCFGLSTYYQHKLNSSKQSHDNENFS